MNKMSVFFIDIPIKETLKVDRISLQIDKFLVLDSQSKGVKQWTDRNRSELIVYYQEEDIYEIMIRVDASGNYSYFLESVIAFTKSNQLLINVRKEIIFKPELLNKEIVEEKINRFKYVENPLTHLKDPK